MARFRVKSTALTQTGRIVRILPGATISVATAAGADADIYLTEDGEVSEGASITADSSGVFDIWLGDEVTSYVITISDRNGEVASVPVYVPGVPVRVTDFASYEAAEPATIPAPVIRFTIAGPDGQRLGYVETTGTPAMTTADGRTWTADGTITPEHCGATGEDRDADTTAFGVFLEIMTETGRGEAHGSYLLNQGLTIGSGSTFSFHVGPGATLDFTTSTASGAAIQIGADDDYTALPVVTVPLDVGSTQIAFASAHGLAVGDLFTFYNPADGSWGGFSGRDYYKKGELCRVGHVVNTTTVLVETPISDSYTSGDNLVAIKLAKSRVNINFEGTITGPGADATRNGIVIYNADRSTIRMTSGNGFRDTVLSLRRCYDTNVVDTRIWEDSYVASSTMYGVSMLGCFNSWVSNSVIKSTRHAVALTGGGITACVPNRYSGARYCHLTGYTIGADMHGACDKCAFIGCIVIGGVNLSGRGPAFKGGRVWTKSSGNDIYADLIGVAIRAREMIDLNVEVDDVDVHMVSDASGSDNALVFRFDQEITGSGYSEIGELRVTRIRYHYEGATTTRTPLRPYLPTLADGTYRVHIEDITVDGDIPGALTIDVDPPSSCVIDSVTVRGVKGLAVDVRLAARAWEISDCVIEGAAIHGVFAVPTLTSNFDQFVTISRVCATACQGAGIAVNGSTTGNRVHVKVIGCTATDNNQANTVGATYKSGIALARVLTAMVTNNTLGDTQSVQTQTYTMGCEVCPAVYERDNIVVGAGSLYNSGSTITNGAPALS